MKMPPTADEIRSAMATLDALMDKLDLDGADEIDRLDELGDWKPKADVIANRVAAAIEAAKAVKEMLNEWDPKA